MKSISEISIELARKFGEEQGRSISQILSNCLGISKDFVHLIMIISGLAMVGIIGIIIYLIVRKNDK